MKKLYEKSKLGFAVTWIIAYCVLISAGDALSAMLGVEKSVTLVIGIGETVYDVDLKNSAYTKYLEEKTGIQTMVVVVTGIEGGDCFDFALRLGKEKGVGQKGRDNGLVVLLSTEERCVQFVTGYGLEGVLPDAICKRIQNKYMVQHLGKSDWDTGMIEGIRALNGYLNGSMTNELQEESEDDLGFIIMGLLFLFPIFFILYRVKNTRIMRKEVKYK